MIIAFITIHTKSIIYLCKQVSRCIDRALTAFSGSNLLLLIDWRDSDELSGKKCSVSSKYYLLHLHFLRDLSYDSQQAGKNAPFLGPVSGSCLPTPVPGYVPC